MFERGERRGGKCPGSCPTWNTAVDNPEKLLVAARVPEERRVDGHRAAGLASAGAIQREMNIYVTVASVRDVALGGHQRVIAAVARTVEHDQLVGQTDDLQNRVETDEFVETAVRRPRQRPHRVYSQQAHENIIFSIALAHTFSVQPA